MCEHKEIEVISVNGKAWAICMACEPPRLWRVKAFPNTVITNLSTMIDRLPGYLGFTILGDDCR